MERNLKKNTNKEDSDLIPTPSSFGKKIRTMQFDPGSRLMHCCQNINRR